MSDLVDQPVTPTTELDADERQELQRLREEVVALRAEPAAPGRRRVRWASIGAALLVVLGCLLVPVSLVAVWTNNQVSDTVISDPSVQAALADRITTEVVARVDVKQIADQAIDALAGQGLSPQVAERLHALTGPLADSTRVSGESSAIAIQGANVVLDLGVFINAAKQQLVASGFELAARIPEIHPTVDLFPASTLVQARSAYNLLDAVATWLPWVTLFLLVGGVLLASNRRRALLWVGVGVMVMMVVIAIALLVLRALLVGSVPQPAAAPAAATFDIVVHFLRLALRSLFAVGLVVACTGFLTGSSVTAVQIRGAARRSIAWLRRGRIAEVLQNGPVGPWVHAHRRLLQGSTVILGVLFVIFLDQPTGLAILSVAVALVVLLAMIEFLNRPAPSVAPSIAAGTAPPNAMS